MAITVGLDFGTHQTKVCIENSDDPYHRTYEFFDWGEGLYALPSVIQINKDRTLSFGKVNLKECLYQIKYKEFGFTPSELPPEPTIRERPSGRKMPDEPVLEVIEDGVLKEIPYSQLYGIKKEFRPKTDFQEYLEWCELCDTIEDTFDELHDAWETLSNICPSFDYPEPEMPDLPEEPYLEGYEEYDPKYEATEAQIAEYSEWLKKCGRLQKINENLFFLYDKEYEDYEKKHKEWEEECERIKKREAWIYENMQRSKMEYPMIFRYFKQATFSSYRWEYQIAPRDLSVLYLAFVIFKLEERFGNNFSIQMGVPASEGTFKRLKDDASKILIQALQMVEDIFENDLDEFLKTPYDELIDLIPQFDYSADLKYQYGIMILPEAYASLRSVTANGIIPPRISVMLDVGGGTTDISFFIIKDNGEPEIYHYESIAKGLNFFLEYGEDSMKDFSIKKELEDLSDDTFSMAFNDYELLVNKVIKSITGFWHTDTIMRGFSKSSFSDAIKNRPIVYSGGGCYDERLRQPVRDFTQVIYLDKKNLRIPNVVDEAKIKIPFSILATSYGLAISIESDDIQVAKKEDFFANYPVIERTHWDEHLEHGMYED